MRGGGSRSEVRKTASSRRRRDRYTQDRQRNPWGYRRADLLDRTDEERWDDDAESPS